MKVGIDQLAVAYDGKRVIDGLSLDIAEGEFFTLLGPSGCGKTTLLRAIAGFAEIAGGRLLFGDRDVTHLPGHKRNIGMVFQDYALFPDKTVFDNVAYGLRARRIGETEIKRKVGDALEGLGLAGLAARHPAALSGGQRQRVALARALVIQPDVLLMDEPLSNLDAKLRHQVRDTIATLQRDAGITTVFVTHDQDEALALSDRIGVMQTGRLAQVGTPAEIYRAPCTAYVADFIGAANIIDVVAAAAAAGDTLKIDLGEGQISARAAVPLAMGLASLIIRPEDVEIVARRPSDKQTLAATVVQRQYLGSRTSYRLELVGSQTIRVDRTGDGHDAYRLGEPVSVVLNPAKTLVLAS